MFDELDVPISLEEIKKGVRQLQNGARAGPDLLLNEFLRNGEYAVFIYIQNLFNKIFEMGFFPEDWSEGYNTNFQKKKKKKKKGIKMMWQITVELHCCLVL